MSNGSGIVAPLAVWIRFRPDADPPSAPKSSINRNVLGESSGESIESRKSSSIISEGLPGGNAPFAYRFLTSVTVALDQLCVHFRARGASLCANIVARVSQRLEKG